MNDWKIQTTAHEARKKNEKFSNYFIKKTDLKFWAVEKSCFIRGKICKRTEMTETVKHARLCA